MFGLRRTMTRVSTLAPNFSIPEAYRKSTGHKVRDFIDKVGGFFAPVKKYLFPNFIAVHYFYIIMMTIITSILLYPVHNAKYIDILFLATGASTQGGLNTIDVNGLTLYQQIIIYITCCLTTPIAIHGFLAFVRLYWFERYFDGIRDFSKQDFKMRRTKTILQREMTRRSFQNHRQRTMSIASGELHGYRNHRERPYGEELQLSRTMTVESPKKSKSLSMNPPDSENITAVGTSGQFTRDSSIDASRGSTHTTTDSTKYIHSRENSFNNASDRRVESNHSTENSNVESSQQTTVRKEGSSIQNFQEKLFSGQLVNRDEEPIPEEGSSSSVSSVSQVRSERANISQRNSLDVRSNESRRQGSNNNSRLRLNEMLDKSSINRSSSNTNVNAEEQRFAKRRNSEEITPQDMLKSIQMLRDQHNDSEDDDEGPALVIEAPHVAKESKTEPKGKAKSKTNANDIEVSRLSVNPASKRTVSNLSRRSNAPSNRPPSVANSSPPAPVLAGDDDSSDVPLEIVAKTRSNIPSDVNDSISSGNAADINDDNSSDEDNNSGNVDDSFAISMNSGTESSFDSEDTTDQSVRSLSLPRSRDDNSMSIASPSIGAGSHFSRLKSNSTTELVAQNHQDLDERIMIHPLPDNEETQPRVKFGPEPDHKPTIHFDIQSPKKNLMKVESAYDQGDSIPQRPVHRRSPSTSGYLKKQIQKGKKFRKNLRRRLSTGSFEKEEKSTEDVSSTEGRSSPTRSRHRYYHEYETHHGSGDYDEEDEHSNIHDSAGNNMQNIIARTVTFDATDKSKLNELAKEPDFQRAVYKQWKKEHKNKRRLKGTRRMRTRYGPKRWAANPPNIPLVPQPRSQTARGALETAQTDDDSLESFNSAHSSPGSLKNQVARTDSSGVPYALYETPTKGSSYHTGLTRPNSRVNNENNSHDDDGYENEGDDNDYDDDDDDRDDDDEEDDAAYYGFHVDNDVSPNFADQIHPLSKTMSSNYLSWRPKVARNSNFIGLSKVQKDELGGVEYRAIKLLCRILVVYYVGFHIMAFVMLLPWICRDSKYAHIVREDGVSPAWWGFFTAMSAFNDLGLTLTPDSMGSFNTAVYPLVVMIWFIIIGNTGFPIFLRFIIWVMFKISPELSHMKESLGFLLDHPRRCFTMLFPESATWWLVLTLLGLNLTDFILFIILDLGSTVLKPIKRGYRVLNGLFQAVSTRTAGFGVVDLGGLNAATQVSYMLMMYVSVLPLAISIRRTNVYEEQSLGMYSEMDESESEADTSDESDESEEHPDGDIDSELSGSVHEGSTKSHKSSTSSSHSHESNKKRKKHKKKKKKKKKKNPEDSTRSFIGQHLRKQLSFDLWFVFLGLFIICICENKKIKDTTMPDFNVFSILFEVISAYGTVGLSLGYPGTNQSFSGRFTTLSKLVIIGMLIRGRNRGLPYSVDRAIILPSERLEHIDHLEDLKLKRRRFRDDASDPLTGFVRGNVRRFTHKVEKTPLYKTFTQDFRGAPGERGRQNTFQMRHHQSDHPHFSHEYFDEEEPLSAYGGPQSDNETFISRHRREGTSSQHQQMLNETIA